jgi:hypothetical protein
VLPVTDIAHKTGATRPVLWQFLVAA